MARPAVGDSKEVRLEFKASPATEEVFKRLKAAMEAHDGGVTCTTTRLMVRTLIFADRHLDEFLGNGAGKRPKKRSGD